MAQLTPKRQRTLARPRASLSNPNLSASYNGSSLHPTTNGAAANSYRANALHRKQSLTTLTSSSLATIPDASAGYGLRSVLDEDSPIVGRMASYTPNRADDLDVGDAVDVPGSMHGTVKFVGEIPGKKGIFAGVELSEEFAAKGKNNGDVDGISYFATSIRGAGIFLPINRAVRRGSPSSHEGSFTLTPTTPSAGNFKVGGSGAYNTPPTPSLPKFSQSVGPHRAPSPGIKMTRPSLPRPESPLRKPQIGTPAPKTPARYGSPGPAKFGQSVRGTQDSRDPSKKVAFTPKNGMKASIGPRSASALGGAPMNYSDDETTPVGATRTSGSVGNNDSVGSISSFNAKIRPASRADSRAPSRATSRATSRPNDDEVIRLRGQLDEKNKQLKEQASSLAEMESSLNEVQALMGGPDGAGARHHRGGSIEDKDATQLRALLREKNEKIAMLTAEFDAHRADFRSTIDTLELASTETERVYERRVEDLLQEIRELQEQGSDVDSVARQLKQLEELVQELEEGLEDARRGEAEARGEVEFLRGEVERTRSELRREREKAAAAINGAGNNGDATQASKDLEQRDDEIRGLKAIIHSLSRDAVPDTESPTDPQKTPTMRQGSFSANPIRRPSHDLSKDKLEKEVAELRSVMESKRHREEELEREVERLRRSSANPPSQRVSVATTGSAGTITKDHASLRDSKGTVASWREQRQSPETHRRANTLETMPESDTYSSATDSVVFCEICESPGHDILTCTNMFGSNGNVNGNGNHPEKTSVNQQQRTGKDVVIKGLSPKTSTDEYKPAPLSPIKDKKLPSPPPVKIIPNPMEQGPVAGKESGIIDPTKWCGVCERDGHESIDCPFEDAF